MTLTREQVQSYRDLTKKYSRDAYDDTAVEIATELLQTWNEVERLRGALKSVKGIVMNREQLRPLMSEHNIWRDLEEILRQAQEVRE